MLLHIFIYLCAYRSVLLLQYLINSPSSPQCVDPRLNFCVRFNKKKTADFKRTLHVFVACSLSVQWSAWCSNHWSDSCCCCCRWCCVGGGFQAGSCLFHRLFFTFVCIFTPVCVLFRLAGKMPFKAAWARGRSSLLFFIEVHVMSRNA